MTQDISGHKFKAVDTLLASSAFLQLGLVQSTSALSTSALSAANAASVIYQLNTGDMHDPVY